MPSAEIFHLPTDRISIDPREGLDRTTEALRQIDFRAKLFSDMRGTESKFLCMLARREAVITRIRSRAQDLIAEGRRHLFLTQIDWIALTGAIHPSRSRSMPRQVEPCRR